jgi:hypothetical protein
MVIALMANNLRGPVVGWDPAMSSVVTAMVAAKRRKVAAHGMDRVYSERWPLIEQWTQMETVELTRKKHSPTWDIYTQETTSHSTITIQMETDSCP